MLFSETCSFSLSFLSLVVCSIATQEMSDIINSHEKVNLNIRLAKKDESFDIGLRVGNDAFLFTEGHAGEYVPRSALERFLGREPLIYLKDSDTRGITTAAHELGHALGLGHQRNSTRSLMSYSHHDGFARNRGLNDKEVKRLIDHYDKK